MLNMEKDPNEFMEPNVRKRRSSNRRHRRSCPKRTLAVGSVILGVALCYFVFVFAPKRNSYASEDIVTDSELTLAEQKEAAYQHRKWRPRPFDREHNPEAHSEVSGDRKPEAAYDPASYRQRPPVWRDRLEEEDYVDDDYVDDAQDEEQRWWLDDKESDLTDGTRQDASEEAAFDPLSDRKRPPDWRDWLEEEEEEETEYADDDFSQDDEEQRWRMDDNEYDETAETKQNKSKDKTEESPWKPGYQPRTEDVNARHEVEEEWRKLRDRLSRVHDSGQQEEKSDYEQMGSRNQAAKPLTLGYKFDRDSGKGFITPEGQQAHDTPFNDRSRDGYNWNAQDSSNDVYGTNDGRHNYRNNNVDSSTENKPDVSGDDSQSSGTSLDDVNTRLLDRVNQVFKERQQQPNEDSDLAQSSRNKIVQSDEQEQKIDPIYDATRHFLFKNDHKVTQPPSVNQPLTRETTFHSTYTKQAPGKLITKPLTSKGEEDTAATNSVLDVLNKRLLDRVRQFMSPNGEGVTAGMLPTHGVDKTERKGWRDGEPLPETPRHVTPPRQPLTRPKLSLSTSAGDTSDSLTGTGKTATSDNELKNGFNRDEETNWGLEEKNNPGRDLNILRSEEIYKLHGADFHNFTSLHPPPYLRNFRNPCWREQPPSGGRPSLHCLPHFFVLGAEKSAVPDLMAHIASHQNIVKSAMVENHFWDHALYQESLHSYVEMFEDLVDPIVSDCSVTNDGGCFHSRIAGESSTSYFWNNKFWRQIDENARRRDPAVLTPHQVHRLLPDLKVIIILREPVERLYSEYSYNNPGSADPLKFEEYAKEAVNEIQRCIAALPLRTCAYSPDVSKHALRTHIRSGLYSVFLKDWLEVYPLHQVHVLRYEDYTANVKSELLKIFRFLKMAPPSDEFLERMATVNAGRRASHPRDIMQLHSQAILQQFYKPYNTELSQMLGDIKYIWGY